MDCGVNKKKFEDFLCMCTLEIHQFSKEEEERERYMVIVLVLSGKRDPI